jgi:nucleoside-diphosphate-sugar epimerase
MKILVTGASSLAASRLLPLLWGEKHDVTTTSRRPVASDRHLQCDLAVSPAPLPDEEFDSLIHFAALVPQNERTIDWPTCARVNIGGTVNLLRWAEGRVKRIVLASSCAVYGEATSTPVDEEHPLRPTTYYAITKYAQEQLVSAFCTPRMIPLVILRLGYVYGPGLGDHRGIKILLRSVKDGQPIKLAAPNAGLHLIHTEDVALVVNHMLRDAPGTFNVVTPRRVTVRMYVDAAMEVAGRTVDVSSGPSTDDFPTNHYSAARLLARGIRPRVDLKQGIATMLAEMS